jgi:hypothetical protein
MITGVATALEHNSCLQSIFFPFIAIQACFHPESELKTQAE